MHREQLLDGGLCSINEAWSSHSPQSAGQRIGDAGEFPLADSHEIAKPSVICRDLKRVDSRLIMRPLRQYAADYWNRFEQCDPFPYAIDRASPVVTEVRSAVARQSPTPAASRPARARYRLEAYSNVEHLLHGGGTPGPGGICPLGFQEVCYLL
jgi:hypothetical protein